MESKQCGECRHEINDLEPLCCGFCETLFHISQNCCGINLRSCRDIFAQGKALFICPQCRNDLNGRSIRKYIEDQNKIEKSTVVSTDNLSIQIQQLSCVVDTLSKKVDRITSVPITATCSDVTPKLSVSQDSRTPIWPRLSTKRRRVENEQINRPIVNCGTGSIDLGDLSVPFITPASPPPMFWLYLSGFQPLISNDDVQKIVAHCLNLTEPANIIRLVPKGKDVTNMSYVSFKIGLDPAVKQQALDAARWPAGLMFREFVEYSKNPMRRPYIPAREQSLPIPNQEVQNPADLLQT